LFSTARDVESYAGVLITIFFFHSQLW